MPKPGSDIDLLVVADPLPEARIPRVREFEAVEIDCGDVDFLPTEEYTREQAAQALSDARFRAEMARQVIPLPR